MVDHAASVGSSLEGCESASASRSMPSMLPAASYTLTECQFTRHGAANKVWSSGDGRGISSAATSPYCWVSTRPPRGQHYMNTHQMHIEAHNGAEFLFVCAEEACGRRLVLQRGALVVIDQGDFHARHVGGFGPISFAADVKQ